MRWSAWPNARRSRRRRLSARKPAARGRPVHQRRSSVLGAGDTPDLERDSAFEVDLEYGSFSPGFHLLAELSRGDLDPRTDATFWGAHTWLGDDGSQDVRSFKAMFQLGF
jgi:hypothetical protein